ncbi:MAG: pilus assembly protein PilB [Lentisphaerae bacterium RIFOXYB12_FULL_65_16]|nr:MAG: pilus assembly protein PilB [Lentisphaerae bacterium RIFOXYA12_64_32]OGV87263.1 MAG: pilus assembly protein PilB [Lentisphaerae bacterium RIFOXYB12_FULL_65_16]
MPDLDLDAETNAIWHLLLDANKATEEQLTEIYEEHQRTGKAFTAVLYNYGIVTEDDLMTMIAENLGTEVVKLKEIDISKDIIKKVSAATARMYGVIPVREEFDTLFVAARDPMNFRMIDELHYVVGMDCRVLVAKPNEIEAGLDHFYPEKADSVKDVLQEMEGADLHSITEADSDDAASLEAMASNAPIVRFVDVILYQAVKDQASDVHFEPFGDEFRIRYRIDGALYEMAPPPKHLAVPVISRVKVLSGLNIAERRLPQDGRIELRIGGRPIDLRVSTLPTRYGESVVLRVLDREVVALDLENLGMDQQLLRGVRGVIERPNGIFVVTGPTGSGKTTTLYSCLKEVNDPQDKLLTAEDPVEYNIEGIIQVPVKESVGMTFARALRAFLRQDPDIIMLGEVRDLETARMAIQASLTGHFVLSTLHTNDAPGAVTRLIDMGVEPFLISSTLIAVLSQRLIRRVCKNCRVEYEPEDAELTLMNLTRDDIGGRKFSYGKGCEVCSNTGYKGRLGLYEFMFVSRAIREQINKRQPTSVIREKAVQEGMVSMRLNGVKAIMDGITTVEEVVKYTS